MNNQEWDKYYLRIAESASSNSKDPSTKCGAVLVDKSNRIVSIGFNGFPRRIRDDENRLNNREIKLELIIHAEENAAIFSRQDITGCCLYTHPFMSCHKCAVRMIQWGIIRHVAPYSDNPRWQESFKKSMALFNEAGVEVILT